MQYKRSNSLSDETDAELYDRYGQAIFAYVRLHIASREDAEDLTLEVFTAALEHNNLAAIRDDERLAWLRRVARNKIIDSYRRSTRHPLVALDLLEETLFLSEHPAPEEVALQREAYKQLHDAIDKLPTLQQKLLQLRYGHGYASPRLEHYSTNAKRPCENCSHAHSPRYALSMLNIHRKESSHVELRTTR